ncbi:MAG: hypothetical protein IJI98_11690 [Methanosphaera sp.]|nr:hypothetical protein [Methanosphaera sp.]
MNFKTIDELLDYTKNIVGKSINDIVKDKEDFNDTHSMNKTKGILGNLVETEFYHYSVNNDPNADFDNLGVELKVAGLIEGKNGLRVKERLVLTMINYMNIVNETFDTSHLIEKNKLILILWYNYVKGLDCKDYKFINFFLLSLFRDKEIIENDYNIIRNKVLEGKAHELSEGDTTYLGACTKASKSTDRTQQPKSSIPAKPRAFCLKHSYMKLLYEEMSSDNFHFPSERKKHNYLSVIEYVESKLKPYFNKTQKQICDELNINIENNPKNINKMISDKIIGKDKDLINIDEIFKYSTYIIKNSPYYGDNKPKERMSFRNISLSELEESWDNSEWKLYFEQVTIINIRYFYENSKSKNGTGILKDVKKITFNNQDLESMKKTYNMLRLAIQKYKNRELGEEIENYFQLLPTPNSFEGQILDILPKRSRGKNSYKTLFDNNNDTTKVAFALTKDFLSGKMS